MTGKRTPQERYDQAVKDYASLSDAQRECHHNWWFLSRDELNRWKVYECSHCGGRVQIHTGSGKGLPRRSAPPLLDDYLKGLMA